MDAVLFPLDQSIPAEARHRRTVGRGIAVGWEGGKVWVFFDNEFRVGHA